MVKTCASANAQAHAQAQNAQAQNAQAQNAQAQNAQAQNAQAQNAQARFERRNPENGLKTKKIGGKPFSMTK